jgi:hypothetical protein
MSWVDISRPPRRPEPGYRSGLGSALSSSNSISRSSRGDTIYRSGISRSLNHSISVVERAKSVADWGHYLAGIATRAVDSTAGSAWCCDWPDGRVARRGSRHGIQSSGCFSRQRGSAGISHQIQLGRLRHCWMTPDREKGFFAPWTQAAVSGTLVVVSPIRAALAQRLGQTVKASVVYRMFVCLSS